VFAGIFPAALTCYYNRNSAKAEKKDKVLDKLWGGIQSLKPYIENNEGQIISQYRGVSEYKPLKKLYNEYFLNYYRNNIRYISPDIRYLAG